ncbi:hypothetical protein GCM10009094_27770 [Massilia aurea]
MTETTKCNSGQPKVEVESMQEDGPCIEQIQPTKEKDRYLVQAFGTCPAPNQGHERSQKDCLTAGPYVAPAVAAEELEHPVLRRVRYLH